MNTIMYDRMEQFILNEIEYAAANGYSRRSRRFMRRKLIQEIKEIKEIQ